MFKKKIELEMRKTYSDDEAFIEKWNGSDPEDRHILVIDEFGNTGPSHYRETKFGYGISDVNNVEDYANISRESRKAHKNDEQKANNTSLWEKLSISLKIRGTETKTSCVYVDKDDSSPPYMKFGRKKRIYGVLNDTLDQNLPYSGIVWVVIDSNSQYGSNESVKKVCKSHSNRYLTVYGNQYSSEGTSLPSDLLQTNDFVANAARSNVELKYPLRSRIMKMRFVQLGNDYKRKYSVNGRMKKRWNPGGR